MFSSILLFVKQNANIKMLISPSIIMLLQHPDSANCQVICLQLTTLHRLYKNNINKICIHCGPCPLNPGFTVFFL